MITKKDLVIVVLATFCLTLTLFTTLPTHSSSSTAALEYDPWLDYNDDGRISLQDLVALAQTYGTTGDPTRNVNVTNFPQYDGWWGWKVNVTNLPSALNNFDRQYGTMNLSSNGFAGEPFIYCGGRSRLSILLLPRNASVGTYNVTFYLYLIVWTSDDYRTTSYYEAAWEYLNVNAFNITIHRTPSEWHWSAPLPSYIIETKAPYCFAYFNVDGNSLPPDWWVTVDYCVYLRNE